MASLSSSRARIWTLGCTCTSSATGACSLLPALLTPRRAALAARQRPASLCQKPLPHGARSSSLACTAACQSQRFQRVRPAASHVLLSTKHEGAGHPVSSAVQELRFPLLQPASRQTLAGASGWRCQHCCAGCLPGCVWLFPQVLSAQLEGSVAQAAQKGDLHAGDVQWQPESARLSGV